MLMSTRICIKCAGRLHQLFDFNLIKTNLDLKRDDGEEENEDVLCEFCEGSEIMEGNLQPQAYEALTHTKWNSAVGIL